MDKVNKIVNSDRPDIVKLVLSFDEIAGQIIANSRHEIEVRRALHDQEGVIREQIKMETLKHAHSILQDCYQMITGKRGWDE
jgi:hypothetical protein